MNRKKRENIEGYLMSAPLLLGCLVFFAIPFILVMRYSLSKGVGDALRYVGLDNYITLMRNNVFKLAFGNTIRFLLVALPLILIIAYSVALLLQRHIHKHSLFRSVLLLPYIMPVVGTVMLVEIFFAEAGLTNQLLSAFGIPVADWLHSDCAFAVTVALYLWKNTGYAVILLLSGLLAIPKNYYAAASLDGASGAQQFRYIIMPQMWYSVFFAMVFSLINAFKCFREIFLIGGNHPNNSIYMLQHFINNSFEKLNYPKLAVASVLLMLFLTVVFVFCYRWVMRKEAYKE